MKNDSIFEDAKDRSFSAVCAMLKEKGQKLRQKSFDRQSMSLSEMQQFLRKEMNNLQSEHKLLFSRNTIQNFHFTNSLSYSEGSIHSILIDYSYFLR